MLSVEGVGFRVQGSGFRGLTWIISHAASRRSCRGGLVFEAHRLLYERVRGAGVARGFGV